MPNLLDLADEILMEILSYIHDEKQHLQKLYPVALVSRRMSNATRPFLFHKLDEYIRSESCQIDLLTRSIDENPGLAGMVRSIELSWSKDDPEIYVKANKLLSKLYHLQTLSIWANCTGIAFYPEFLESNKMQFLKDVTLRDCNLTISRLAYYMFIDSLEFLHVNITKPSGSAVLPKSLSLKTCHLTTLELDSYFHLAPEDLREVLQWTVRLKKLSCAIPGRDLPIPLPYDDNEIDIPLSPSVTTQMLRLVKDTLEELHLSNGCFTWLVHDGSRMDLSMMRKLKLLSCPASCLFVPDTSYKSREGLFELLPSSLEELKINFEEGSRLITPPDPTIPEQSNANTEAQQYLELSWLSQLIANKKTHTPNLRRINLSEFSYHVSQSGDRATYWVPPSAVLEGLQQAGISHMIYVGRPGRQTRRV